MNFNVQTTRRLFLATGVCAVVGGVGLLTSRDSRASDWITASSPLVESECDKIFARLVKRYGAPRVWKKFPVIYKPYNGGGILGYTRYSGSTVLEVVVYEGFEASKGATLDHELTHAFFFYWLDSNFDLFINEGLAQNSEWRRRDVLRQTVYKRYRDGEFVPIESLYGRNSYDGGLVIYHEGFSVVDFLIAKGGSKWLAAFVDAITNGGESLASALRKYYGFKSVDEFERAWERYVEDGQDRRGVDGVIL